MRRALAPGVLALALAGCGSDGGAPGPASGPGRVDLALESPNATDGALVIRFTGAVADSATPLRAGVVAHVRPAAGGGSLVAVIGDVRPGPLVRLHLPDLAGAASFRATVEEAAATSNELRGSVGGYTLRVTR